MGLRLVQRHAASACRPLEGVCSLLRQDGVKGAADSGALVYSGLGGGRGTACWVGQRDFAAA